MKAFIIVFATIASGLAYPTNTKDSLPGPIREKKSASYGSPAGPSLYGQATAPSLYGPPASAAAPVSPTCTAPHAPAPSPIAFYLAPAGHLPPGLHYRSDNENEDQFENMMTSDNFDQMQARSYGDYSAASSVGPAVGLFPKANIGGCAIPLLLSCAPTVTSGKMLKAQHAAYPAAAETAAAAAAGASAVSSGYSYRSNGHDLHDEAKMEMKEAMLADHNHAAHWFEMDRAGHPEFHAHHLTPDMSPSHNHQGMHGAFTLPMQSFTHQ